MARAVVIAATQINEWITSGRDVTESDVSVLLDSLATADVPLVERPRRRVKSTGKVGSFETVMYVEEKFFIGLTLDDGELVFIGDPAELEAL